MSVNKLDAIKQKSLSFAMDSDIDSIIATLNERHDLNKSQRKNMVVSELIDQIQIFGAGFANLINHGNVQVISKAFHKIKGVRPEVKAAIMAVFPNIKSVSIDGERVIRFINGEGDLTKAKFDLNESAAEIFIDAINQAKLGKDPRSDAFKALIKKAEKTESEKREKALAAIEKHIETNGLTQADILALFGKK